MFRFNRWFLSLVLVLSVCWMSGCHVAKKTFVVHTTQTNISTVSSAVVVTRTEKPTTATTTMITRAEKPTATTAMSTHAEPVLLDVLALSQYPDYPTGCESVTAVMALNHIGNAIGVEEFITHHLPCNDSFYEANGRLYGPDPYAVFIGDPRRTNSYGCMAPVIEQALRTCVGEGQRVVNTTGETLSALCRNYVDNGIPVILWATMEMRPVGSGRRWFLPDGRQFTWPSGEHCLLLVGYNDREYLFNDPRHGAVVAYDKKSVEIAYASLGKQSLVIQ